MAQCSVGFSEVGALDRWVSEVMVRDCADTSGVLVEGVQEPSEIGRAVRGT
jgi:hypothetical protein